ncbi:GNAT family N-acetyltransferase [Rufibacter sediminis]|uniref:GNAT family N-acetyltransferase n=1 Tax=Rufibacter sediminis TaxID=2762756 RepID=A0ABR6VZA7_9BACT|nr:GNAT family N-acetyltransferase [Rufibacter sediminis]MBC3542280.1 GNAT family N-acetyltransferase [Rufibacter sediminis]
MPGNQPIRQITAEQTWPIRQLVMWPDKPLKFVQLPNDGEGVHFGYFVDEELVSVLSLFIEQDQAQFRKFATLPSFQGQGIGRSLLAHVFTYAQAHHIHRIWCHARTSATGFYRKSGMQEQGEIFEKDGLAYVKMEKRVSP